MTTRKKQAGITLMELMVVMVIIALLSAIAIPSYRQYTIRANRTDAKTALLARATDMEKCMTRFNAYDDAGCGVALPYTVEGDTYQIQFRGDPTPTTFVLEAVPQGGQAEDADCGTFSIDQANVRETTGTASNNDCWRR